MASERPQTCSARRRQLLRLAGALLPALALPRLALADAGERLLRFGIPSYFEPTQTVRIAKPVTDYLTAATGIPVLPFTRRTYRQLIDAALAGDFDLLVGMPNILRYLEKRAGFEVVASVRDDDPVMLVTSADRDVDPADLRGSIRIAVVDPLDLSSALSRRWIASALRPDVSVTLVAAGSSRNALELVLAGRVDAAALLQRALHWAGPELRSRVRSHDTGIGSEYVTVLGVSPRLQGPLRDRTIAALRGLAEVPEGRAVLMPLGERPYVLNPDLSAWDAVLSDPDYQRLLP